MGGQETIAVETAEEIYEFDAVAIQEVSKHRWYTRKLVIYSNEDKGGAFWGFYYLDPLTEVQEGQDCFEADPVPVFPVVAREVVAITYEPVESEEA